ncbi:ATP-binding cassette domain-containing protein, partial [Staphylococcus aureus]
IKYSSEQQPFIRLSDVSFRYANTERFVLNKINIDIAKGDQIALVGPSGAGKSTLTHIISGAYSPTSGIISTNQDNINIGI